MAALVLAQRHRAAGRVETGQQARKSLMGLDAHGRAPARLAESVPVTVPAWLSILRLACRSTVCPALPRTLAVNCWPWRETIFPWRIEDAPVAARSTWLPVSDKPPVPSGAPARRDQGGASGPAMARTTSASGVIIVAARAGVRTLGRSERAMRIATATTTAARHATVSRSIHAAAASLPVPRPCATATGQ